MTTPTSPQQLREAVRVRFGSLDTHARYVLSPRPALRPLEVGLFEVLRRWLSPVPPSRPPPPKPPDAPIDKLLDGLTVLGRTVGRLLVRVESLEGQVKTEMTAVRGDLAKLEPQPQQEKRLRRFCDEVEKGTRRRLGVMRHGGR